MLFVRAWSRIVLFFFLGLKQRNCSLFSREDISCLFLEQSLVKLIWYSIIGAILPWSRIIISSLKDGLPINGLVIGLFFQGHSPDSVHRLRFVLGVELVVIHAWTDIVDSFFLESSCFGVEIALTTHVMAGLFAGLEVVLTWTWHFLLFELLDLTEAISGGMKTRIYCFWCL